MGGGCCNRKATSIQPDAQQLNDQKEDLINQESLPKPFVPFLKENSLIAAAHSPKIVDALNIPRPPVINEFPQPSQTKRKDKITKEFFNVLNIHKLKALIT